MTPATILDELRERAICLEIERGDLRIKAPKGAMTDALRQMIREHKAALIAFLSPEAPDSSAPMCETLVQPGRNSSSVRWPADGPCTSI
jgi:hypothetical protein